MTSALGNIKKVCIQSWPGCREGWRFSDGDGEFVEVGMGKLRENSSVRGHKIGFKDGEWELGVMRLALGIFETEVGSRRCRVDTDLLVEDRCCPPNAHSRKATIMCPPGSNGKLLPFSSRGLVIMRGTDTFVSGPWCSETRDSVSDGKLTIWLSRTTFRVLSVNVCVGKGVVAVGIWLVN